MGSKHIKLYKMPEVLSCTKCRTPLRIPRTCKNNCCWYYYDAKATKADYLGEIYYSTLQKQFCLNVVEARTDIPPACLKAITNFLDQLNNQTEDLPLEDEGNDPWESIPPPPRTIGKEENQDDGLNCVPLYWLIIIALYFLIVNLLWIKALK